MRRVGSSPPSGFQAAFGIAGSMNRLACHQHRVQGSSGSSDANSRIGPVGSIDSRATAATKKSKQAVQNSPPEPPNREESFVR